MDYNNKKKSVLALFWTNTMVNSDKFTLYIEWVETHSISESFAVIPKMVMDLQVAFCYNFNIKNNAWKHGRPSAFILIIHQRHEK